MEIVSTTAISEEEAEQWAGELSSSEARRRMTVEISGGSDEVVVETGQSHGQQHLSPRYCNVEELEQGDSAVPIAIGLAPKQTSNQPQTSHLEPHSLLGKAGMDLHPGYDRLAAAVTSAPIILVDSKHLSSSTDQELPIIVVTESNDNSSAE